jgi:hypothetical protein
MRWHIDDLLFMSAIGEGDRQNREIAFRALPPGFTMICPPCVCWAGMVSDTPLKLEPPAGRCWRTKLHWPADPRCGSLAHAVGAVRSVTVLGMSSSKSDELAEELAEACQADPRQSQ